MATLVQILGESGTGKTYSMRNLTPKETLYINCDKKNMPFKGWKNKFSAENKNYVVTSEINMIYTLLKKVHTDQKQIKVVIIDTLNSIMSDKEMSERKKKGYDKWMDLAGDIYDLYRMISTLRDDLTVICLAHTEDYAGKDGLARQRLKTNGAKLTKLNVEGLSTYTLYTTVVRGEEGAEYKFLVQNDGTNTARSPEGVFASVTIPNDLDVVVDNIQQYENA